jgi:hypothetical protein
MQWLHEQIGVVATIDAKDQNNQSGVLSDAIDMSKFRQILAILNCGNVDNAFDMKLQASATAGGSYADITGKAITQLAAHATNNDGKIVAIALKQEEMPAGKQFVKVSLTVGNGTANPCAVIVLGEAVYAPATNHDLADVAEIIK